LLIAFDFFHRCAASAASPAQNAQIDEAIKAMMTKARQTRMLSLYGGLGATSGRQC